MKRNFTILIVDDAFFIRNLLKRAINNKPSNEYDYDFSVLAEAENGKEGLELFKIAKADIVTVDVKMPHIGGVDFIKAIRKINPNVQIIVISASLESNIKEEISNLNAYYMDKPFQEAFLWTRLDEIANTLKNINSVPTVKRDVIDVKEETAEVKEETNKNININQTSPEQNKNTSSKKKKKKKKKKSFDLDGNDSIGDKIGAIPKNYIPKPSIINSNVSNNNVLKSNNEKKTINSNEKPSLGKIEVVGRIPKKEYIPKNINKPLVQELKEPSSSMESSIVPITVEPLKEDKISTDYVREEFAKNDISEVVKDANISDVIEENTSLETKDDDSTPIITEEMEEETPLNISEEDDDEDILIVIDDEPSELDSNSLLSKDISIIEDEEELMVIDNDNENITIEDNLEENYEDNEVIIEDDTENEEIIIEDNKEDIDNYSKDEAEGDVNGFNEEEIELLKSTKFHISIDHPLPQQEEKQETIMNTTAIKSEEKQTLPNKPLNDEEKLDIALNKLDDYMLNPEELDELEKELSEGIDFSININENQPYSDNITDDNVDSANNMELNIHSPNYNTINNTNSEAGLGKIAPPKGKQLSQIYSDKLAKDYNIKVEPEIKSEEKPVKKENLFKKLFKKKK